LIEAVVVIKAHVAGMTTNSNEDTSATMDPGDKHRDDRRVW